MQSSYMTMAAWGSCTPLLKSWQTLMLKGRKTSRYTQAEDGSKPVLQMLHGHDGVRMLPSSCRQSALTAKDLEAQWLPLSWLSSMQIPFVQAPEQEQDGALDSSNADRVDGINGKSGKAEDGCILQGEGYKVYAI